MLLPTSKYRKNRFMDGLNLPLLKNVARKQRKHQQHDHDKERPGAEELLFTSLGRFYNEHKPAMVRSGGDQEGRDSKSYANIPSSGSESKSAAPTRRYTCQLSSIAKILFLIFCS